MTDFPDLKLKALVNFPASATGGTGIDVEKVNGNFVIDLAYEDFAPPVGGVSDPTHQNALLWNSITDVYTLAPISLIGSGGSVPEAPNDGVQYGRQSLGWTPVVAGSAVVPAAATPLIESGLGAVGTSLKYAREDHVHPASGSSGGPLPSNTTPQMDGVGAVGTSLLYTRDDHVHPTDTSRAPVVSPAFTGTPTAPTAPAATNTTQIATTAFVGAAVSASGGVTPSALTGGVADTNVTLALSGTPTTALLQPTTITLSWSGTLAASRGGFGADVSAKNGVPVFATGVATFASTTGTGNVVLATGPALGGTPTAPTPAIGTNTTQLATTAFVQQTSVGKNHLINGRFAVSQVNGAAASTVANYIYASDMWRGMTDGATVTLICQRSDLVGNGSNGLVQTPTANLKFGVFQPIENADILDLVNGAVTLSVFMGVSNVATITNVKMAILQWTGAVDAITNPISAWNVSGTNPTLAANWAYINTPANLGVTGSYAYFSVSGTVGATAKNLGVLIWCDSKSAAAADFIVLGNVQLVAGSLVPSYEFRPLATELYLCKRHFAKTTVGLRYTAAAANQIAETQVQWPVQMRAAPVATLGAASFLVNIAATFPQFSNTDANSGRYQISAAAAGDTYAVLQAATLDARL